MKKVSIFWTLVFSLFVLCTLISCSEAASLKSRIIGKWVNAENLKDEVEFFKDGTVIFVGKGDSAVGDYKFIDDNRVRMDIKGLFGPGATVFEVFIDTTAEELSLKEPTGKVSKFLTEAVAHKRKEAETYNSKAALAALEKLEQRVNDFIGQYKMAEVNGVAVVGPPSGGDVFLVVDSKGVTPVLKVSKGERYNVHIYSKDREYTLSIMNMNVKTSIGYNNVFTLNPTESGRHNIMYGTKIMGMIIVE